MVLYLTNEFRKYLFLHNYLGRSGYAHGHGRLHTRTRTRITVNRVETVEFPFVISELSSPHHGLSGKYRSLDMPRANPA
jgi:hypothetical protein